MSLKDYPVNPYLKVIKATDIYKTDKWWKAVVTTESQHGVQIAVYLWTKDRKTGDWKRKQKMGCRTLDEESKIHNAVTDHLREVQ